MRKWHGQAQASVPRVEQHQLTGLLDTLIEIINATEAAILEGLDAIKSSAQDSERVIQTVSNAITSGTRNLLTNLKDDLNQDLDKLKNQTSPAGKKLIDCVQSEGNVTVEIAVRFVNNSLGCVGGNFGHVAQIIPPLIDQIEAVVRTVQKTTNGLEDCNKLHLLELIKCVKEVGAKASDDIKPVIGIIKQGINDINKAVEEYLGKQTCECVKKQREQARKEVLDAFNELATCATK
nr:unnamed protein product [Callosobruchus chinensis]